MQLQMRRYDSPEDYWRIRSFLRQVFVANGGRELSWQAYRFDYWRWHGIENMGHGRLEHDVFIWETQDGDIRAVLNREGPGQAFLQVHPDGRSPELEEEMIATAEQHLAAGTTHGRRKASIWVNREDRLRQASLKGRGYEREQSPEHARRRSLSVPIADVSIPDGYHIRALGDVDEHPARSRVSWKAFHPNAPDDEYEGADWYANVQRAPLYRRDLDLVAVAPTGEFASFCTIWFDDCTRSGAFEPVGTAPAHQQRGLGKALMCEGLRRLQGLGATLAFVGSFSPAAHALYAAAGFTEYEISDPWSKTIQTPRPSP
ncbi:MAG: GNAT family N-acetyltransferase [Candidatus Eisenbacteria sp.]|nr:GNAT family N-acetyltransferase [Candidatus Eisenbacteria bacterium]